MIALVIALLLIFNAAPAFAQFGGSLVSDPPVEQSTAQTANELNQTNSKLQQDVTVNTQTAASLTTPGDTGLFQGVSGFLDTLDGNFNGTINSAQVFSALFPGWVPLPADAIPQGATITTKALATYNAALTAAQTQAAGFDAEETHLGSIEAANLKSTGLLQAVQINTEAQLAVAQQVQMLRQLEVSHITLEATKAGEELNERAQTEATSAQAANLGASPQ
jgi:hypothetical protein